MNEYDLDRFFSGSGGCGCSNDDPEVIYLGPQNKRVRAQLESGGFGGSSSTAVVPSGGSDPYFYTNLGVAAGGYAPDPRAKAAFVGGGLLLDAVGGPKGAWQGMKSLIGWGDYKLRSNSLVRGGGATGGNVRIIPQGERAVRIVYREYIGDVFTHPTTPGAFSLKAYPLNPGLLETFSWLPPIAQQYEQWTPNGIVFEFRSTSSEYVATQALGSVIMATEYDQLDTPYASKVEMLNSAYSNEAKPSEQILHGIECDPRDNPNSIFYVRSGAPDGDIRDYDLGTFYVATQGGATANLNLGSLYVHYDLTFRKEQLFNGIPIRGQLFQSLKLDTPTLALPLGSSAATIVGGNMGPSFTPKLNKLTFPEYTVGAHFVVILFLSGTPNSQAPVMSSLSAGPVGMTRKKYFFSTVTAGTSVTVVYHFEQTASAASLTFSFPAGTYWDSNLGGHLTVMQVSDKFVLPGGI